MFGRIFAIAALASVSVTTAPSVAQAPTRDTPNPWLDCGIGAMIFPR